MAYTEQHRQALETALAKGEKRVIFGDRTVEYRSVEELKAALREVKRSLIEQSAAIGSGQRSARQIRIQTRKGT